MAYLTYCVVLVAILIMSVCIWITVANPFSNDSVHLTSLETDGELTFVHVLYRHGDRTPVYPSPGSDYDADAFWPQGWGQLTTLGMQQEYALGQWFRRRYSSFLSDVYHTDDIYVRSSDVDRTLMSAQSVLAGLYPPFGNRVWNSNLRWQPIPVHTVPVTMDQLIGGQVPSCPAYENAMYQYAASEEMREFEKSILPIYDYIEMNTGTKLNNFYEILMIRDTWFCESTHNYTLPQWVQKLYPNNEEFEQAAMKFYYFSSATKVMAKFMSGFLLKDILDRFTSKVENSLSPDRKLWMYSSHDSTLFSFLHSLDVSDNQFVPYAGAITMELRKYEDEYYVQMFYKYSARNPEAISIPGCGTACPLSRMYEIYDEIIPKKDFDTECLILGDRKNLL